MKFSFEWLKGLSKFKQSSQELADLLTMYFAETSVSSGKRVVLNVDLLANRVADAASHLGLAREISAILGKKFSYPQEKVKEGEKKIQRALKVKKETANCLFYSARMLENIKVKISPLWLQKRILDCGLRPVNNIVDAANYVMLETGQPLHVFDYDKLGKSKSKIGRAIRLIRIRQAQAGEKIRTLDSKDYSLDPSIMVIADSEKALALAGIKGGQEAEVDKNTKTIVLESANFKGANIRHASRKLGLVTDASLRFEHNLSPDLSIYTLERLAILIKRIAGGSILQGKAQTKIPQEKKIIIPLIKNDWERFLGETISQKEILKILSRLGFSSQVKKKYLLFSPPSFRNDIKVKEDVMGEVVRLQGIDKIKSCLPVELLAIPPVNESWQFRQKTRDWLRSDNLNEVYNYSFLSAEDEGKLPSNWKNKLIEIDNPTSGLTKYLRPSLLFNLLKNISSNSHFRKEIQLFEIGKVYWREKNGIRENFMLGGILAKEEKSDNLFYQGKGIIEDLFSRWGVDKDDYRIDSLEKSDYATLFSQGAIMKEGSKIIAVLGVPSGKLLKEYDCPETTVFWEIDLAALLNLVNEEREFQPLPKFPAVIRDISLLLPRDISVAAVLDVIQSTASSLLEDVDLFDIYEGEISDLSKKSLSFHLIFRAVDHTLQKEEIDREMNKIYQSLQGIKAKIR